jgi:hypothetical protein
MLILLIYSLGEVLCLPLAELLTCKKDSSKWSQENPKGSFTLCLVLVPPRTSNVGPASSQIMLLVDVIESFLRTEEFMNRIGSTFSHRGEGLKV